MNWRGLVQVFLFAVANVVSPRGLLARPQSLPGTDDIRSLIARSSVVCRGLVVLVTPEEVPRVEEGLQQRNRRLVVTVKVDRLYKGELQGTHVVFDAVIPQNPASQLTFQDREYALVFLKRTGNTLELTDRYSGKLRVSRRHVPDEEFRKDPLNALSKDFILSLGDESREVVIAAVRALGSVGNRDAIPHLRALLATEDVEVQGWAYLSLTKLNAVSSLEGAVEYAQTAQGDSTVRLVQSLILQAIGAIADEKALPELHAAMGSKSESLRINAVRALRAIRSPSSVSVLVRGLDDPALDVRYDCMMALAVIDGRGGVEWAPSRELYVKDEAGCISRWKEWWTAEGKAKYCVIDAPP